jgi:hypothetical protein
MNEQLSNPFDPFFETIRSIVMLAHPLEISSGMIRHEW